LFWLTLTRINALAQRLSYQVEVRTRRTSPFPSGDDLVVFLQFCSILILSVAAQAQEALPLAELLSGTHFHGIAAGTDGFDSATLATHDGVFAADMAALTAMPIGSSRDDFTGFSPVPGPPERTFACGHPLTGGCVPFSRGRG
jgi:hypothetical protein